MCTNTQKRSTCICSCFQWWQVTRFDIFCFRYDNWCLVKKSSDSDLAAIWTKFDGITYKITEYLIQMNYQSTTRRVGAVLNLLGHSPGAALKICLDQAKQKLVRDAPHAQISLLPGFEYTNLDPEWLVKLP